jgi:hypothetical protein
MNFRHLCISSSLFLSVSTFAATVAEVRTSGGFAPVPPLASGLRLQDNGTLIAFRGQQQKTIARLSVEKMQSFMREISAIHPSDLRQENPDAPICADAPTTSFVVIKSDQTRIEIARNENCKLSFLSNGEGHLIFQVLKGLGKLDLLD